MIQIAAAMIPEVVKMLRDLIADPDTYRKIEGVRLLLEKLTGNEIDKNGLVTLLEGVTQGEPYTGKWELIEDGTGTCRRLRVDGGWLYDIGRGNGVFIQDK